MSKENYGIEILHNAIRHENTWIPLDQIGLLSQTEIRGSFFKAMGLGIVTAAFIGSALGFGYELLVKNSLYLQANYQLDPRQLKELFVGLRALPVVIGLYIFYRYWTVVRSIQIVSSSGERISVSQKTCLIFYFFLDSMGSDELFEKILAAKDRYSPQNISRIENDLGKTLEIIRDSRIEVLEKRIKELKRLEEELTAKRPERT